LNNYKLQLTNGYYLKLSDVSRLLKYIFDNKENSKFSSKEIRLNLGITENHFESLSAFSISLGLLKSKLFTLTDLGMYIANYDIYFEKEETLNILHYNISSVSRIVVWNRLINNVFKENDVINNDVALKYFNDLSENYSENTMKNKLPKEILSVLFSYGEQNFTRLKILEKIGIGKYKRLETNITPLQSFEYALFHFRDLYFPGATALLIGDITEMENSPGRLFFIDKIGVLELLQTLHSKGDLRIESVGDLNQIRFSSDITKEIIIKRIYGEKF